jgi:hypothetical protein
VRFEDLTVLQVAAFVLACGVPRAVAQVAPGAGNTTGRHASIKVGVTFFGDYTVVHQPKVIDADGNAVTGDAFNVGRAACA